MAARCSLLSVRRRRKQVRFFSHQALRRICRGLFFQGMKTEQTYNVTGDFYTSNLNNLLRFYFYIIPDYRVKDSKIYLPSQKIYLTDNGEHAYLDNTNANDRYISNRHSGRGSILLSDGHVRGQTLPANIPQYEKAQCKPSETAYIINSNKSVTFY